MDIRVAGKLYLAGEYAVVEAGQPALILAMDKFMLGRIHESKEGYISSYKDRSSRYFREKSILYMKDPGYEKIVAAIGVVEQYLREIGIPIRDYNINIVSQMDREDGIKYGLGSSAAISVLVVRLLDYFYGLGLDDLKVYKLAVLSHIKLGLLGSFGDIAASSYGSIVYYQSPDRLWLRDMFRNKSINWLISNDWKDLYIESFKNVFDYRFMVGFTGEASSTSNLLENINNKINMDRRAYDYFLYNSSYNVKMLYKALKYRDIESIRRGIIRARELLLFLSSSYKMQLESPQLTGLIAGAEKYKQVAKFSGSGGGDCGLVFIEDPSKVKKIRQEWKKLGIEDLKLNIYDYR